MPQFLRSATLNVKLGSSGPGPTPRSSRSYGLKWLTLPAIVSHLLLTSTLGECSPTPVFFATEFRSFDSGADPRSMAVGDLNEDGNLDLATANFTPSTVSVLLGNGDGTFGATTDLATGLNPASVAIADLNADGNDDLVTVNYSANTASVLLGNGDGTFGGNTDFGTGVNPASVAVGDQNGDGKPDLAIANRFSNTVSVLLGIGDGTFGPRTDFVTGGAPISVALGDLNADGNSDLVTANYDSSNVSVLLGNGDGTFGGSTDFGTGGWANSVAIRDLNADGRPDLAVAADFFACEVDDNGNYICNYMSSLVSVLLGNGDGAFGAATDFGTDYGGATAIAIGDLNADGTPDLVTVNSYATTISVLLGKGDGTFGGIWPALLTGTSPTSVAMGDLNMDGKLDLATANTEYAGDRGTLSVLLGNGDGTFGAKNLGRFGTGYSPTSVAVGDLNADGKADLVATTTQPYYTGRYVSVQLGNGAGTFGGNKLFLTGTSPTCIAVGDLNADGRLDVVTANFDNVGGTGISAVSVLLGNGDGTLGPKTDFVTGANPVSVAIADLNADGKLDLATASSLLSTVSVLLGNGNGTFGARTDFFTGSGPASIAIGDPNADGKPDLMTADYNSNTVSVLFGNGNGTFGTRAWFPTGPNPASVAIGDLNTDGKLDLVTANAGSNSLSVLLGIGDGNFGAKTDYGAGSNPRSVAIADLNTDGKPDLAAGNSYHSISVLLGNGDGTFEAKTDIGGSSRFAIGNLNADSRPDIVIVRSYVLSVLWNLGPSITTGVSPLEGAGAPRVLRMDPAYPNPFGARVHFPYGLPHAGRVLLVVYDVQGRRVATLVNRSEGSGRRSVDWDGRDANGCRVASGTYFARIESSGEVRVRKIVVAR
jgi:hypothetical protein